MPLSAHNMQEIFTNKDKYIKHFLHCILNMNIRQENNEKIIITTINKLLSTAKNRSEGLEYLDLIINTCSPATVLENACNWIDFCIIRYPDDVLRELKLRMIGRIIEVAHKESDFNKKFVSDYLSKVFDNCLTTSHVNLYECRTALKTLSVCLEFYPTWFGTHRQAIEDYLLIFIDSENLDLVQNAAFAFHHLQQVGNAGMGGLNYKQNFTKAFHKLCSTVHMLYNKMFESEKNIFELESAGDRETFQFRDDLGSSPQNLLHINSRRVLNLLKFIEIMIRTKFSVAKETKPKELLEVIRRGISIHKCVSGEKQMSLDNYHFSLTLYEAQAGLLKLLRLFILWYQLNCLPFSYSISKILVDCIEKSHNCECFQYDSLYQELTYKALTEWISVSKSSLHPQFQSRILLSILKDITPVKFQVTLTISDAASGKKSQKAKRKAMIDRIISSGKQDSNHSSAPLDKPNQKDVCLFALSALKSILKILRLNVKSDLMKNVRKIVIESIVSIQTSKSLQPYTNSQCQLKLYEVLVALYYQKHPDILPPIQTTLDLLTRGASSNNKLVSAICQDGIRNLEILCQPICPTIYMGEVERGQNVNTTQIGQEVELEQVEASYVSSEHSFDFDASTDECSPSHNTSQEERADSSAYNVKYPDTDQSIISDGQGEKNINEHIEFIEISSDNESDNKGSESCDNVTISDCPIVSAPSEDGNEILEKNDVFENQGEEKEFIQVSLSKLGDPEDEENEEAKHETVSGNIPENPEINSSDNTDEEITSTTNDLTQKEDIPNNSDKTDVSNSVNANSNTTKGENLPDLKEGDEIEEPPLKKAKINSEDQHTTNVLPDDKLKEINPQNEVKDEDPDDALFDEDTFVDEVKKY